MGTYSTRDEYVYHRTETHGAKYYMCHDSPSAYWPGMHKDVQEYVVQCQKCQVNKAERLKAGGLLQPLEIPQGKWESISMDL